MPIINSYKMNSYSLRNEDFIDTIDVVCLKCNTKALVLGGQPYLQIKDYEAQVQFSCTACGYTIKYSNTPESAFYTNSRGIKKNGRILILNAPCDPFFGFDLWYRIDTRYGLLWAYNIDHLSVIEKYIADPHRSRNGIPNQNNSIASRLPEWTKEAKNRDYIVKIIKRYKAR